MARLDGMFALALWDARRRRLLLARDPFGKKPLYYWHDARRFVFGSEIKALLAAGVPAELDEQRPAASTSPSATCPRRARCSAASASCRRPRR